MKIGLLGMLIVGAVAFYAGMRVKRELPPQDPSIPAATAAEPSGETDQAREPASIAESPPEKTLPSPVAPRAANGTFAYARELGDYMSLRMKVLMTDDERAEKARLLSNKTLVRSLASLLHRAAALESEEADYQNEALDLLFDALSSSSGAEARAVLKSVIQDAQIENEDLEMQTREALGGLKAEVMYQWAAKDPARAKDIQGWLPGPVSQKIWKNVVKAHENNLRESAAELEN